MSRPIIEAVQTLCEAVASCERYVPWTTRKSLQEARVLAERAIAEEETTLEPSIEQGDTVTKTEGYEFRGIVIAKFYTLAGKKRFAVESTVPGAAGIVHIFNEKQIRHVES